MTSLAGGDGHANDEEHTLADDIVVKKGYLQKLGGGDGGRQNWKKRFFVYKTKTLEYYENESVSPLLFVFRCGKTNYVGRIRTTSKHCDPLPQIQYRNVVLLFRVGFALSFAVFSLFPNTNTSLSSVLLLHLLKDHTKGKKYKGVIVLDCYYAAKNETKGQDSEFSVYAYPKNMTCRASTTVEMQEWIDLLNAPGL